MHAHDGRVDHLHGRVMRASQRIYNLAPDAHPPPANKAIATGGVRTKNVWQVPARRPRFQHPKDAVEDTTVVYRPDHPISGLAANVLARVLGCVLLSARPRHRL